MKCAMLIQCLAGISAACLILICMLSTRQARARVLLLLHEALVSTAWSGACLHSRPNLLLCVQELSICIACAGRMKLSDSRYADTWLPCMR